MDFNTQVLTIEGMHCDSCVRRVAHVLGGLPGVRVSSVEVGTAHVLAQPHCEERLRQALAQEGFTLKELHASN